LELVTLILDILTDNISLGPVNMPFSILGLVTRVVLPFLGMIILYRIIIWGVRKILDVTKLKDEVKVTIQQYLRYILKLLVVSGLALSVGNLLGNEVSVWVSNFLNFLNKPFFVTGNTRISIITLLMLIPVFYMSSWSGKYARRLLESSMFERFGMDEARRFSIGNLTRYFVMILVFLFGMSMVGIDLSALGVLLGVLGIGLGFGLQGIVGNFFAGLIIITSRPIKEGDRVLVNGYDGIVQNIRFINTEIKTFENENIILPNSHFTDSVVHNYSYNDRKIVIINEIGVSYDSDLDEVVKVLKEINERNPYRSEGPENVVRVLSFGDNSINLALRSLIRELSHKADAFSWTNMEIWRSFKEKGIEIPFPQRVVYIKTAETNGTGESDGVPGDTTLPDERSDDTGEEPVESCLFTPRPSASYTPY
jgi:small-conductance mechanosensitive channel